MSFRACGGFVAVQVEIRLPDVDGDRGRLELDAARLRAELLVLDVSAVVPLGAGQAPPGTRAVGASEVGALLVDINQVTTVLGQLVTVVGSWLHRNGGTRSAELVIGGDSLTVSGITSGQQERLIKAWLRAHSLDELPEG